MEEVFLVSFLSTFSRRSFILHFDIKSSTILAPNWPVRGSLCRLHSLSRDQKKGFCTRFWTAKMPFVAASFQCDLGYVSSYLWNTLKYHRWGLFISIPFHTIPYHSIPFHTVPYHSIPLHNHQLWKWRVFFPCHRVRRIWSLWNWPKSCVSLSMISSGVNFQQARCGGRRKMSWEITEICHKYHLLI